MRSLVLMNPGDMAERGGQTFDLIDLTSDAKDGSTREVKGYRLLPYDLGNRSMGAIRMASPHSPRPGWLRRAPEVLHGLPGWSRRRPWLAHWPASAESP